MSNKKDLTGQPFGQLIVIRPGPKTTHGQSTWLCRCSCGREVPRRSDHLVPGKPASCGSCHAPRSPRTHTKPSKSSAQATSSPTPISNPDQHLLATFLLQLQQAVEGLLSFPTGLPPNLHVLQPILQQLQAQLPSVLPLILPGQTTDKPPLIQTCSVPADAVAAHFTDTDRQIILATLGFEPDLPDLEIAVPPDDVGAAVKNGTTHSSDHAHNTNGSPNPKLPVNRTTTQKPHPPSPPRRPYRIQRSTEEPGGYDAFLKTDGTDRFLGRYPTTGEAQFAGELAHLLQQTLTPDQRRQQDIRLAPHQAAHIGELEQAFNLDEATRREIKEEVALQILDGHQAIIW